MAKGGSLADESNFDMAKAVVVAGGAGIVGMAIKRSWRRRRARQGEGRTRVSALVTPKGEREVCAFAKPVQPKRLDLSHLAREPQQKRRFRALQSRRAR